MYKEFIPSRPLQRYMTFIKVIELDSYNQPGKIIPYGYAEVIIRYGGDPITYINNNNQSKIPDCSAAGLFNKHLTLIPTGKVKLITAGFKPYGLWYFFKYPVAKFNNQFIDLRDLVGNEAIDLLEQLHDNDTIEEKVNVIEKYFLHKLPESHPDYIDNISKIIIQQNGLISINELQKYTCVSLSTLERKFKAKTGFSPKLYARIRRFNYIFKLINENQSINWQDIISSCGYFDQAHFIKEFTEFAGESPSAYFNKNNYSSFFSGK